MSFPHACLFPCSLSGIIGERLPIRYYLTFGMLASGAFTALFGLGYFYNIHSLGFYVVTQVRTCSRFTVRNGMVRVPKQMLVRGRAEQRPFKVMSPAAGLGMPSSLGTWPATSCFRSCQRGRSMRCEALMITP